MTLSAPSPLTGNASTADSATYATASVTPAAGARVLVVVSSGKAANLSEVPTSVTHPSIGALTLVRSQAVGNNNQTVSIWTGVGTGTGGAFTITHAGVMDNCIWDVLAFTSTVATPTVKQSASNNTAGSGSVSVTLASGVTSGSCVLGVLGVNLGSATAPSVGSGFTQVGTTRTSTSPTTQQMLEYDNTSPFSTVAFTVASTAGRSTTAVEVADGVVAPPAGIGLTVWDGTAEVPVVSASVWNGTAEVPATAGLT